jgi:putative DNA primase/helicase
MSVHSANDVLRPNHAEHLARFHIPSEILEMAGVRSVTDFEGREVLGLQGYQGADLAGILFPYLSPSTGTRVGGRIRLDCPLPDGGKYISESGCRHFFFPPGVENFLHDLKVPVVIVEAEKSALAIRALADRAGQPMLPIAIGGCWGWRRKTGNRALPDGGVEPKTGPGPDFDLIAWQGRSTILAFDSNARTSPKVQQARHALAKELTQRGAHVLVAEVPAFDNANGPDDLIAFSGDDALLQVLDSAMPFDLVSKSTSEEWPEPAPLGDDLRQVPGFDLCLLPSSLRPLVSDVSERMQTPLDFAASAVVVALAGCVGRRASIQPKANDTSWVVIPNIWGAIIAPPGYMKSPVLRSVTRPLTHIEEKWREEYQQETKVHETEKEMLELKRQAWKELSKVAIKKGSATSPAPENSIEVPAQKRLILTDSTFEKLHEILSDNPAGVLVIRDELPGWLAGLDRQGREQERSFFLEAWNGDSPFTVDRIGRGSVHVPAACVSLFGNIQPSRLRSYLSDTITGGPGDDGLFQRFQVLVWPDTDPDWVLVDRVPNPSAVAIAEKMFVGLSNLSIEAPVRARFTQEAQSLFFDWLADLEGKVRGESGLHPAMVAHLSKYRSLMPSLALLFELADLAAVDAVMGANITVSLDHAKQSAAFCEYLEAHARRVYACIVSPETRAARDLARHIQTGHLPKEFKTREAYLKGWSGLDTPERIRGALSLLEDAGWVRRTEPQMSPGGGRKAETWIANPKVIPHA